MTSAIRSIVLASATLFGLAIISLSHAQPTLRDPWPNAPDVNGQSVDVPSYSPFAPSDIADETDPTMARVTYFAPVGGTVRRPAPAVILLHGSGGVLSAREYTYGRQLAAMGIGAAVVDVFAARRDRATAFIDRIIEITETMAQADAFATLAWLERRPEIDARRVALWGFSYGAMSSMFATSAAISDRFANRFGLGDIRFAGHIAFYGPCIATFEDKRTTGAPVLMAWGDGDALMNPQRCAALADDMRAGGSPVEVIVYPGAYHQWDGGWAGPRKIGRLLDQCEFRIGRDLDVRSGALGLPMVNPFTRKIILALCVSSEGYLIGSDEQVRALSNRAVAAFLNQIFRTDQRG